MSAAAGDEETKAGLTAAPTTTYSTASKGTALASVVAQTDASGRPIPGVTKHAAADTEEAKAAPSGWRRFFCCLGGGGAQLKKTPQPYLSDDFDSVDIDYEEVQRARSLRKRPLLGEPHPHHRGKKCLVLDLDETLVHSSFTPVPNPHFIIPVVIDAVVHHVYVCKRPHCDMFLERVSKHYEVVLFTASLAKYADPLLDQLDRRGTIASRLFREDCVLYQGKYVKDLALMNRDLRHTVIVDNSPCSYLFHPENAVGCESFIDDMTDPTLYHMAEFLESIADVDDVRKWLHAWQGSPHSG